MNSFRSYKLKLPNKDSYVPHNGYDTDGLLSTSGYSSVSDNDDYADCQPGYLLQGRGPKSPGSFTQSAPNTIPRFSSFVPMDPLKAAERLTDVFRSRYPFGLNVGANASKNQSFTEISPLLYNAPLAYAATNLLNNTRIPNVSKLQQVWNSVIPKDKFAKDNDETVRLRIDGVTFPGNDVTKEAKPESKNGSATRPKIKATRKKAGSRFFHLGLGKSRGCFKCTYCSRRFSYVCHLKVHERVHTGEKPYSCEYCSHQFSQLGSLTVHMRIHTGAKPYQCGECWKKFRHVNSLRRHQRQVHSMSSEEIAHSIDKVKDAVMLEKQLGSINESARSSPPAAPFDFRAAMQFCGIPLQWYGPNGIWNQAYKNMFVFGQHNESITESQKSEDLEDATLEKKKPPKTWRPFEEYTDETEGEKTNESFGETPDSKSPAQDTETVEQFRANIAGKPNGEATMQEAVPNKISSAKSYQRPSKNIALTPAKTISETDRKGRMSDGYASMEDELSSCSSPEEACGERYRCRNQFDLVY